MGERFIIILFLSAIVFSVGSCTKDKLEIRRLQRQIADLQEQQPEAWQESCRRAVDLSCYLADCAKVSIEDMQERICRLEEE